jgi:Fe-S-cluster-containing dehydrogenase component
MSFTRRSILKVLAAGGAAAVVQPAEARERKAPGPDAVGMLYDSTRCIGCRACVGACKRANDLPADLRTFNGGLYDAPTDLNGQTKNVIKLVAGSGRDGVFMKTQCMHCVDPACVSVCMMGALHKVKGGVVAYAKDTCVGCRYCQVACPFNVPKFEWSSATPQIVKCELCRHRKEGPACCEVCPREAVIYGKRADLLEDAKRRIAESPGKYQPRVYGEAEAGGTQVLYLSAAAVPFELLGLPKLKAEPAPELSETVQHGIYKGFLAPAALYGALAITMLRNRHKAAEGEQDHGGDDEVKR